MTEHFDSPPQAVMRLRTLLKERYRAPLGGLFTGAVTREQGENRLLTGKVVFFDTEPPARNCILYDTLMLLEEWITPLEAALERLAALMEGGSSIAEQTVATKLKYWRAERRRESHVELSGWPEWVLEGTWDASDNRPSPSYGPVTGFGLPPFTSGNHAVSEWVWGQRLRSSEAPHINKLLTVLPDTRGRILAADWTRENMVRIELEANVLPELLELQVLFEGSVAERHRLVSAPPTTLEMEVPKDTESIFFYLVHSAGALLGSTGLSASNRKIDVRQEKLPLEAQAEEDLKDGENDEVEFKPFIESKNPKEKEIVETVVAFANTRGGRLYMGLDDHRGVQGLAELKRMHKGQDDVARDNLLKHVRKLIGDKVRPVPKFSAAFIEYRGDPVAVVTIDRGEQPPYATDNDEVFVRKGSSNVRPDPLTELPDLCARRNKAGNWVTALLR